MLHLAGALLESQPFSASVAPTIYYIIYTIYLACVSIMTLAYFSRKMPSSLALKL